jgi:hypothetical protein
MGCASTASLFCIPSAARLTPNHSKRRPLALRPSLAAGLPLSRMMTQQAQFCSTSLALNFLEQTERFRIRKVLQVAPAALTFRSPFDNLSFEPQLKPMSDSSGVKTFQLSR